jgi:RNase P subunit RPR2
MNGMKHFPGLACLIFITALILPSTGFTADTDGSRIAQAETIEEALELEIDEIAPEPQRMYCAHKWNDMYNGQKADIEVRTRGEYNEIVVFHCPDCSLKEHFAEPFLESEYRGKTGMMRLSECGFRQAVFKGTRGTHEIVVDVPSVFPDPARLACIEDWSEAYREQNSIVQISSLGELNEVIVFTCLYCPSQKSFIAPFLLTVHDGKTAMERMRECGFKKVVFANPSGTRRVIREVR